MALEHELFDDLLRFVIQFPIAENRYQITNAYRRALDERDAALSRAEAAERRVAELEAAQKWFPVTEPPDKADWRSGFIVATESEFVYYADEYNKGSWLWGDGWMKEIAGVTYWRPLPQPPTPATGSRKEE